MLPALRILSAGCGPGKPGMDCCRGAERLPRAGAEQTGQTERDVSDGVLAVTFAVSCPFVCASIHPCLFITFTEGVQSQTKKRSGYVAIWQ